MKIQFFDVKKLEGVGLSEIVLESFPGKDHLDFFLQKETCTKETPRDTITLEGHCR